MKVYLTDKQVNDMIFCGSDESEFIAIKLKQYKKIEGNINSSEEERCRALCELQEICDTFSELKESLIGISKMNKKLFPTIETFAYEI